MEFVSLKKLDKAIYCLESEIDQNIYKVCGKRKHSETTNVEETTCSMFDIIAKEICKKRLFDTWHKVMHNTMLSNINNILTRMDEIRYSSDVRDLITISKEFRHYMAKINGVFGRCDHLLHGERVRDAYEVLRTELIYFLSQLRPVLIRCEMLTKKINNQLPTTLSITN